MARRPEHLIYGVDDKVPLPMLFLLSFQHIFLMSSTLVLPVVLVTETGGGFDQLRSVVALTMIACGLGTIFQAFRFGWFGSGYLCPNLCGPNFFTASMTAAWLGGMPLMRGMTIVAGLVEVVFARTLRRVKFLFPPEITGLVVLMVAMGIIPLGVSKSLGINYEGEPIQGACVAVAFLTLLVMVGVNIWGKGKLKLYSVLGGLVTGYLLSLPAGLLTGEHFRTVAAAPWLALPSTGGILNITFKWSLVPIFAIVSITGALKSFGNLIMCEKVNDSEWTRPDTRRVGNGLMADAFCVTVSGLLGGMASDTSASNVAFSAASGATSRYIGYMTGALFIALGFFPRITGVLCIMPMPVMGAILIFVTCFMIISGIQIIMGAGMDNRKTFVIGISIIFGLSLDLLPALFVDVPNAVRPLFESSLTLSTVLAVVLNQVLRLGELVKTT
jgi:xanthine permease XanP